MSAAPDVRGETELLARVRSGDAGAYGELLRPYHALLHHLARRLRLPGVPVPEEELVQAGYVGLMRAALHFDAERGVRFISYAVSWALGEMRAALRAAFEAPEMKAVSLNAESPEGGRTLGELLPGDGICEEAVELRLALFRLDARQRRIIALRYYEDRTQTEVARLLGSSQAQVSRMERQALDCLRALLS